MLGILNVKYTVVNSCEKKEKHLKLFTFTTEYFSLIAGYHVDSTIPVLLGRS